MKISVSQFRGEAPRISPRALPEGFGQSAVNCRLLSGDLEAWRNFKPETTLCKTNVVSVYPLRSGSTLYWLEWSQSELDTGAYTVHVARPLIGGDQTQRVYFTGTDLPRWTNFTMATSGTGCMPKASRPLGVPSPSSPPTVSGNVSAGSPIDIFDDLNTATNGVPPGWQLCPQVNTSTSTRLVEWISTGGVGNTGRLKHTIFNNSNGYAIRDFGVGNSDTVTVEFDFRLDKKFADEHVTENLWLPNDYQIWNILLMCTSSGDGATIVVTATEPPPGFAIVGQAVTSFNAGPVISSVAIGSVPPLGTYTHFKLVGTKQSGGTYSWNVQAFVGSTQIINATVSGLPSKGGFCGISTTSLAANHGDQIFSIDNFHVTGTAPPADASDDLATSYVYTFVNDIGEESGPSPASATVIRDSGSTVVVTTPTTVPSGIGPEWGVTSKRIYRAVTGATGTAFYFVAEIPLATATYNDNHLDSEVVANGPLISENWSLPPHDLRGILALPNGIMAGFRKNQLCLSAQDRPHAWPVEYRLATDFEIVGIGAIDTMVVICTEAFPYIAAGNSPDAYSMAKLEIPQGCVSGRSIAYIAGIGVLYASPDGLVAVSGPGRVSVVTEKLFSRREWQALKPSSIIGLSHDNRYFGFYDTGTEKGGFVIDFGDAGFGKVSLAFHAGAGYSDPLTDSLFLVLDQNSPPGPPGSPASGQFTVNGGTLYRFDEYDGSPPGFNAKIPYRWKSKSYLLPYAADFRFAVVKAESYDDLTMVLYANGQSYYSVEVTGDTEIALPTPPRTSTATQFHVELYGTARVYSLQIAEDVSEID
jgi:hypothetical protein